MPIETAVRFLEQAQANGRHVLHTETGTIGTVKLVLRSGWRCGFNYTALMPTDPQEAGTPFDAPIVQLEGGDAFWVKPGAFIELPEAAGVLHAAFTNQLAQLLIGLGVAAAGRGLPMETTAALAMAALRLQLRRLAVLQNGVSSSVAAEAAGGVKFVGAPPLSTRFEGPFEEPDAYPPPDVSKMRQVDAPPEDWTDPTEVDR